MSKNKKKDANAKGEVPIDYQVESKNLQYTITLKDMEIDDLLKENAKKKQYITDLEEQIKKLKKDYVHAYELENIIKGNKQKIEQQDKEIENLNNKINDIKKKNEEEKKQIESNYQDEIHQLKVVIDSSAQKVEMANQLSTENQELIKEVDQLKTDQQNIINKHIAENKQRDIKNQIKFSNLKNKMKEKIDQIQAKETELNVQYMDVSTKLTLLQNHQLLIQLEYQSQQLDEVTAKKEALEKKVFELTKDIEIHKEVELSLAEKNKKLKNENNRLKNNNNSVNLTSNNNNSSNINKSLSNEMNSLNEKSQKNIAINITEEDKSSENNHQVVNTNSFNNISTTVENNGSSSVNNNFSNRTNILNNNQYTRMLNLEKKVLTLEKKLMNSKKEYNIIKDKNEYIEKILRNYEKKYSGLFKFFEDCLDEFFNDEELTNNQEIFVNIDSIRKCDFSNLNKEEKYTTLIILMKYLMPLMDSSNVLKQNQGNNINNVNLKFYMANKNNYADDPELKKLNLYFCYIDNVEFLNQEQFYQIEYLDLVDANDNVIGKEDRDVIYQNNWRNFRVININDKRFENLSQTKLSYFLTLFYTINPNGKQQDIIGKRQHKHTPATARRAERAVLLHYKNGT